MEIIPKTENNPRQFSKIKANVIFITNYIQHNSIVINHSINEMDQNLKKNDNALRIIIHISLLL